MFYVPGRYTPTKNDPEVIKIMACVLQLATVLFVFLVSNISPCPLDTRVIDDDRGSDICQCCRFANGGYNVYCNSRGFSSVPPIPPNTTYLDLRHNPIHHLTKNSFPLLVNLASLLMGNDTGDSFALQTVDSDAFINLLELKTLTLSVNLKNITSFLNSAKKLTNLTLCCANDMTQKDFEVLFSGLKLELLEAYNCSFDLVEHTFLLREESTAPTTLHVHSTKVHVASDVPPTIHLPSTNVGLWFSSRFPVLFSNFTAHSFTVSCAGATTTDCLICFTHTNQVPLSIHVVVESYIKTKVYCLSYHDVDSYSLKFRNISNFFENDFIHNLYYSHWLQNPKVLLLSTDYFPEYRLLPSDFLSLISSRSRDISLRGFQIGEIKYFNFASVISFTCANCLLYTEHLWASDLRKFNITDSDSKVLINLTDTLSISSEMEELVLNTKRLKVDMSGIPYHTKLIHLELSAISHLSRIPPRWNLSALVNLERLIIRNIDRPKKGIHEDSISLSGLSKLTLLDWSDWSVKFNGSLDDMLDGLPSLIEVRLSNNRFWDSMDRLEQFLKPVRHQLQILDVSNNLIDVITPTLFRDMYQLRRLDLSKNALTSMQGCLLRDSVSLSLVSFADNRLETVDITCFENMEYLREVNLYGNRLHCNCQNRHLQAWMLSCTESSRLLVHYDHRCPNSKISHRFRNYRLPWIDCDSNREYVALASCTVLIGMIVAAFVAVYYYRYDIAFWWVVKRRYRINRRYPIDPQRKYHAFLSYTSSEQELAHDIFFKLEEGEDIKFRIAYDHRDFLAGFTIADNIIRCIDQSEKVLFLISRRFLVREWCEFEMNFAQMRCFDERKNLIILIFVEKFETKELPKRLRILCRHVNYLQYPDESDKRGMLNFWHRLRLALAQDSVLETTVHDEQQEENFDDEELYIQTNRLLRGSAAST